MSNLKNNFLNLNIIEIMKKYIVLLIFSVLLIFVCCETKKSSVEDTATELVEGVGLEASDVILPADLLDNSEPPYDVAKESSVLEQALFAWKEIIALSWKSTYTAANPQRAIPDTNWSYKDGTPDAPLVWESFAHRLEYRPEGDVISKNFDSAPSYTFEKVEIDWNSNSINPANHFVVLDEDNEIGSCYVFAKPNIEENTIEAENDLIMYMAKVNREEYDYRKNYFNSTQKLSDALNKIKPSESEPGDLDKLKEISTYRSSNSNDPCGAAHYAEEGYLVLPCSDGPSKTRGVIEIKTAWRPLKSTDNRADFLVRPAVTFDEIDSTKFKAQAEENVLVGIHIIHKTNNFRQFFIATWEHNSVDSAGYKYALVNPTGGREDFKILPVERHDGDDGAYSHIQEAYGAISTTVQAKIKEANPNNFLANYRLTGFQSDLYADKSLADRKTSMPAYYLANLIIESDDALSSFSGSGFGKPFDDGANTVADGKFITSGGCSGCHGVAQVSGADFSFLNDLFMKPVPEPEVKALTKKKVEMLLRKKG